ncbi:IS3 family transposase [Bacillus bingmayongensis]|nr:IS3 family transposase [Bacillus bingmayongensis]
MQNNTVIEDFLKHLKSKAFYSPKITRVSNIVVRKSVLAYIHYYNCMLIQENLNYLSPKKFREQVV